MRAEVLAQVAVERRERVGRREALLEQQPHRVAFVAEGRLHAHQHVAEAAPEHEDRGPVAELATRRRAPLGLDLRQPTLAPDVVVGADQRVHVRIGAVGRRVAGEDRLAQCVDAVGQLHRVALGAHRRQGVVQRLEHREVGGRPHVAGIRREVEQHDRDLALGPLGPSHRDHLVDPGREHHRALRAAAHVLRGVAGAEGAAVVAAGALHAAQARPPAEYDRAGGAVEFGDRDHDGALDRQQPAVGGAPGVERLELDRMRGDVGQVELGEDVLGGAGIVVRRPAHQREARQRHHRIDDRPAVLHEELVDRRACIESGAERRHHAQALRLHRRDHAVVVAGVAGQQVRPQHQQADRAARAARRCEVRQVLGALRQAPRHPRVVHAELGILDRLGRLARAAQRAPGAVGITIHQEADHVVHVVFGAAEPVLQGHEVRAHVLGGARHEAQHLRDPAQHLHLRGATCGGLVLLVAAQSLQQRERTRRRLVHVELAEPRELDHLGGRHRADHRITLLAAGPQGGQDRQEMILEEQHRGDDDVAGLDVGDAALERLGVGAPLGRGVQRDVQPGRLATQPRPRAVGRAREVGVHRHDDDVHSRALSG